MLIPLSATMQGDAGVAHQTFHERDEHRVIGADEIVHRISPLKPFVCIPTYQLSSLTPRQIAACRDRAALNNVASKDQTGVRPVGVVISLEDGKHVTPRSSHWSRRPAATWIASTS
jgi:hypothetical protein